MPDKYELFRSSLSVPLFENINQSLFQLLQTPKYQEYTDMIFSTLGQELENYFKKDMIFKYRYKSQKSFTNNISKDSIVSTNDNTSYFTSRFNPYVHYDIIGMRLVVKNISNDFKVSNNFINSCKEKADKYQKKLFDLQKQYFHKDSDTIENEQDKLLEKEILHIQRYLIYLDDCCNFNTLLKKLNKLLCNYTHIQEKMKTFSNQSSFEYKQLKLEFETTDFALKNLNSLLNTIAGEYAIEEIFEKSEKLKKLGVHLNSKRQKFFSEDQGYTSMHFSIESSVLPNWISELQDRSSSIEYLSIHGHDALPGKKRKLLNLPSNLNKAISKKYVKSLNNISPNYTIYRFNGYIERYNMKKNVHHYYSNLLVKEPIYTKKLDSILDNKKTTPFLPNSDIDIDR